MRQRHLCISRGSNVYHNALRSWHPTMYNAQCNNSEENLFWIISWCLNALYSYTVLYIFRFDWNLLWNSSLDIKVVWIKIFSYVLYAGFYRIANVYSQATKHLRPTNAAKQSKKIHKFNYLCFPLKGRSEAANKSFPALRLISRKAFLVGLQHLVWCPKHRNNFNSTNQIYKI